MKRPAVLAALALLLVGARGVARADATDDYIREQMRRRHIPGLALAVARPDGTILKARGYGLANVELSVPATPRTVFEIGSITKQITAAAVLMLVEEGRVGLDDPIGKHLPEVPAAWAAVTVRHLLTHTSGIRSYTGLSGFELSKRLTREQFTKGLAEHPLAFAPGESWSYNNSGYNLLGHIIERASGRTYWEFLRARIFGPLRMTSAGDRDPKYIVPHRASGYEWRDGALVGRDYDLTDVFAAGAIVSNVLDLVKWDAGVAGGRLLRRSSLDAAWTPVTLNGGKTYPYGFGWNVETFRGRRRLRHNGQTAGFSASISRYPEDRLTFIVLCNLGDLGLAGETAQGVAKFYIPALSLRRLAAAPDPDPRLTERLRRMFLDRLADRLAPEQLTPPMRNYLATERAREERPRLASYGPLRGFTLVERETSGQNRISRYRVGLGTRLLLVRFALAEDDRLAELRVEEEE